MARAEPSGKLLGICNRDHSSRYRNEPSSEPDIPPRGCITGVDQSSQASPVLRAPFEPSANAIVNSELSGTF
jgi:hypothetical protein